MPLRIGDASVRALLLDTNVLLDVLLERTPHLSDSAYVLSLVERGAVEGLVCATTTTTIYYIGRKQVGQEQTREELSRLLQICQTAPVDHDVLASALELEFGDYEDAVLHEAARRAGAEAVVTRNTRDFEAATLAVYTPAELRAALRNA